MKKQNIEKIAAVVVLIFLISASAVQAVVNIMGGTTFTWEDDFSDNSKIDTKKSSNIEVAGGRVVMTHTYKAWHYPWPYMKEITITNSGSSQPEYVLPLEVYKNSHMQSDFSDIRFVNVDDGYIYDLEYWRGEYDNNKANFWVRVSPEVPSGTSKIYMFYGDTSATSHSSFNTVFVWDDRTAPDIMISYKNELEGAWDPDAEWGGGRFLVAWEERIGPQRVSWPVNDFELTYYSCIHGRTYNYDGGDPNPSGNADIDISPGPPDQSYHAEDPSIAYGNGKFFVAWEQNPAGDVNLRYNRDIYGSVVTSGGSVSQISNAICEADGLQADPCVAYGGGKFLVVWEDARLGQSNYNVWGRFYSSSGSPSGSEFKITSGANYEGEPWVAYGNGFFVVVYEEGDTNGNGPFSLYAKKLSSSGSCVWTTKIVQATSTKDNVYPSIAYNSYTDQFLITWNDGDLSSGKRHGNIWGNFLKQDGNLAFGNFKIQSGSNYVRTDCAPYLEDMFFVSYDKGSEVWGKIVYNNGGSLVMTGEQGLSDGSSQNLDWNNLAACDDQGRIFAVWEDDRDQMSQYSDAFGSVWHVYKSGGSTMVKYSTGSEHELVEDATLMSKEISSSGVQEWQTFFAEYGSGNGNVNFYVCSAGGSVIHTGLGDISNLPTNSIRLKAVFHRDDAEDSPYVDSWGVEYLGPDNDPPWCELYLDPPSPNGNNGWYKGAVDVEIRGYDDESGVDRIYYKIDGGETHSTSSNPCTFTIRDTGTHSVQYWAEDYAGNKGSTKTKSGIKLDGRQPRVNIKQPSTYEVEPGTIEVVATVSEEGSGIASVGIYLNNDPDPTKEWTSPQDTYYLTFEAGPGETHDIEVKAYDKAGNMGNAYVTIFTSPEDDGTFAYSPQIGYLYTVNGVSDNPLLHALLLALSLSVVITDDLNIWIKPDPEMGEVSYVKFELSGGIAKTVTSQDDGEGYYRYNFDVPTGFYKLVATYYDVFDNTMDIFEWKGSILFINAM